MYLIRSPVACALLALSALEGCGSERSRLAVATIDTLPNGAPSVMSPGPTAWADTASGWHLVPAGTVAGETGTPGELIDPQSIAVDAAGRIYVTDSKPAVIKVFGPDGRFLHAIGREGEGPGEFKAAYLGVRGSSLVVHDPRLARTSVFDTSGALVRSWKTSCCYYSSIGIDTAGRISIVTMATPEQKRYANYVRYTLDGTFVDTIFVPQAGEPKYWTVRQGKNMMMSMPTPASPQTESTLDPLGGVLYGYSADYRIVASRTGRDTAAVFGRAWSAEPISGEWRHATVERMVSSIGKDYPAASLRESFREDEIPGTFPAFDGIAVDGLGNRWVRRAGADSLHTAFDVFDAGGRFLGPVVAPRNIPAYNIAWTDDAVYFTSESEEGTPAVARYRIEKGRR